MKRKEDHKRLDELYALEREGADVHSDTNTHYRNEQHVFTENGEIIPSTRGIKKPESKKGETFRRGAIHSHPRATSGNHDDHRLHLLEEKQTANNGNFFLNLFRRKVTELKVSKTKRDDYSHFEESD